MLLHMLFLGYTPLAEAVWKSDAPLVKILLEAGAKVTKSHYLLHYCVVHRNYHLVKLLLDSGCLINLRDENGDTPLHIAARTGEVMIIDILLQHGKYSEIRPAFAIRLVKN